MALASIPPWLEITPQFFTSAMERGASAGLSARKQDEEESAADRLKLAYDTLASQERVAAAKAKADLDYRNANLLLKAHENANLQQYRNDLISVRQDEVSQRAQDAADRLAETSGYHKSLIQGATDRLAETSEYHKAMAQNAADRLAEVKRRSLGRMDDRSKALLTQDARDLAQTQRQLDRLANEPVTEANTKAMDALRTKAAYLRNKIQSSPQAQATSTNAPAFKVLGIRRKDEPAGSTTDTSDDEEMDDEEE